MVKRAHYEQQDTYFSSIALQGLRDGEQEAERHSTGASLLLLRQAQGPGELRVGAADQDQMYLRDRLWSSE